MTHFSNSKNKNIDDICMHTEFKIDEFDKDTSKDDFNLLQSASYLEKWILVKRNGRHKN